MLNYVLSFKIIKNHRTNLLDELLQTESALYVQTIKNDNKKKVKL